MRNTIEIINPGIYVNMDSYWAMHYCAIIETIYEHKTLESSFQRDYMLEVFPSLGNFVGKSGFAFFKKIQDSLKNFGLQTLLCHYLLSSEGKPIFDNIVTNLSNYHDYDLLSSKKEYGVFVSAKDFRSGAQFLLENNPFVIGHNGKSINDLISEVAYADLCFLFKGDDGNHCFLGEVEGVNGYKLLGDKFWIQKRGGEYYSFGIGVKERVKKEKFTINGDVLDLPPTITGQWIDCDNFKKYVVIMESNHSIIDDFHNAIGTLGYIMTMWPNNRANYDPTLGNVLNIVKHGWDSHILDVISQLRSLMNYSTSATLGTNNVDVKKLPKINI